MPTLLLVEDDADIRFLLSTVLGAEGFDVVEAETGERALDLVGDVDLVLLDIRLPGIDGFEVFERLPDGCSAPVVAMSAHTSESTAERARAMGFSDYVFKPFDARDVAMLLWRHLEGSAGGMSPA